MHSLLDFISHTSEGFLNASPFNYLLSGGLDIKEDYSGIHYVYNIKRLEGPGMPEKHLLTVTHSYQESGQNKERTEKIYDEVYFKLMNLMLEGL